MHIADSAGAKQANFEVLSSLGTDAGPEALELGICYRHGMLWGRIGA